MLLLSGSKSTNWDPRYQVGGNHQGHLSPTWNWSPSLLVLAYCWSTYPIETFMGKASVWPTNSWITPPEDLRTVQIQLVQNQNTGDGLGFKIKPGFSSALYLLGGHWASYFKSQNLSSLNWDPKVLRLEKCCVHAHFRKIPPAAVWGMGWRGETRDSSEAAE